MGQRTYERRAIFLGLLIVLSGSASCSTPPKRLATAEARTCRAQGGYESRSPFGSPFCQFSYIDGGKTCSAKADCQGRCQIDLDGRPTQPKPGDAVAGKCQAERSTFGCYASVEEGKLVGDGTCVD